MKKLSFPSLRTDGLTLILGLGETGAAAALWCAQQGASLRVLDTRKQPGGLLALQAELDSTMVDYCLGPDAFTEAALAQVHTLVLSPGLSPLAEPVKSLLALAAARDIEVVGEVELFARALADLSTQGYTPQVLAVTGTNGKTTVTAMARQLVEASGLTVRAAGNIGPAALSALRDALAADALPDVWVLELSSFQLETLSSLAADAAVVLNISQDHLDWHGDLQAYVQAKARLLSMTRLAIVNRDDPLVAGMVPTLSALNVRSFGRGAPVLEGDLGLDNGNGMLWLAAAENSDFDLPPPTSKRKKAAEPQPRGEGRISRLMPMDVLRIRGLHNALNALAALALARALGLGWASMLTALGEYRGEPHRTYFVRNIGGVDFVDDSKGTNVGATVAALDGMGARIVLIAGGLGKGQDFTPLCKAVREHARAVILIGQDAAQVEAALAPSGVAVQQAASMEAAVNAALAAAQAGDTVLLSPACASMDMFKNYVHRGECFIEQVSELALSRGEVA